MNCWHCDRPAHGHCRFCGRAICKEHHQERAFILEIYRGADDIHKAVVVENTLWCGICKPQETPVPLESLK